MRSIKAIIAGTVFILVAILMLQLAYIFIAVGYNALAKDYPFLNDMVVFFRYIIGIPLFAATMFIGGYITANIVSTKIWLHCLAVGLIVAVSMFYPLLEHSNLTITGIFVFILALAATIVGGLYWQKNNRINQT
jgi:hypothetical protein